jgi:hypothetical protein
MGALGEAASMGPVRHVLDWFHLAMRIQHVAQCVKGWPDATADEREKGADLATSPNISTGVYGMARRDVRLS